MYQYISAISKLLDGNKQYVTEDISNVPLNTLFTLYSKVIVILSNPFLPNNVAIDLETIRTTTGSLQITLNEFLIQNGNTTLEALPNIPTLVPRYAKYNDGFRAGYKIAPINPRAAPDTQLPLVDKSWLHLTQPNVDYDLFYKSCLVTVNGFFHLTDSDTTGVYVIDGMKSALKSKQNQLGIYSFREIGALSFVPIIPDMIYKQNVNQPYKNDVYLDIGVDVSNKTIVLVIGGYLHVLDNKTFSRVGLSTFKLNVGNLPMLERYYESEPYLDFSTLPLSMTIRNPKQLGIPDFFSDENIVAYLTLSQSFFVILDNPDIFVNRIPVDKTTLPDMFVSYRKPEYPLIVGVGKAANYWSTYEDGQYSVTCRDTMRCNFIFNTIDPTVVNSVGDNLTPNEPLAHSNPYFLEIGSAYI